MSSRLPAQSPRVTSCNDTSPSDFDGTVSFSVLQRVATCDSSPVDFLPTEPEIRSPGFIGTLNFRVTDLWMQQRPSRGGLASGNPGSRSDMLVTLHSLTYMMSLPLIRKDADFNAQGPTSDSGDSISPIVTDDARQIRGLDCHMPFSYYSFLQVERLSTVQPDDVRFLEYKGCLHLPARPALDEFVREYFLHVHPSLPFLYEGLLWSMYEEHIGGPEKPVRHSLFVFQAMLFATCSVCEAVSSLLNAFRE